MEESRFFNALLVYTDGACSGNPGKGGWGCIVVEPQGHVVELGSSVELTTNNRMEISGALHALRLISQKRLHEKLSEVIVLTDSTYVIRGITQWIWGWRKNNWRNAQGEEVSNRDLWEELSRVVADLKPSKIEWLYVRGHAGQAGNERCDEIATSFAQGRWVSLYEGPLTRYSVPVYDIPELEPLPEMRPKVEKVAAHSYLSLVDGVAMRHADWISCERRVKGRSGAKFKKAQTRADEEIILKSWGLDLSKLQR